MRGRHLVCPHMDYDLGFFDKWVNRVNRVGEDSFAPKVLPMSLEWTLEFMAERGGFEPPTPVLPV